MRHALWMAGIALLVTASPGFGEGIDLRWNGCFADGGPSTRTFACNTNSGTHTLVVSFVAPAGLTAVNGVEGVIDVTTTSPTLPAWWSIGTGRCRAASAALVNFDFTAGPFGCYDYWQGGAIGGISLSVPSPDRLRISFAGALPAGDSRIGPIPEGVEVYAAKIVINNSKTTGLGACAGCSTPACITLRSLRLTQTPGRDNKCLIEPAMQNFAYWQGSVAGCPSAPIDDALTIDDASMEEGNSGTPTMRFTVRKSGLPCAAVSYFTTGGSAIQGTDFASTSGRISFSGTAQIGVPLIPDSTPELDETFTLTLHSVAGATIGDGQGVGTIVNDDGPAGVEPGGAGPPGLVAWPNPAVGLARLAFSLPRAMTVRMDVFDLSGRRVRALAPRWLSEGPQSLVWDGLDDAGASRGDGLYLVRLQGEDFEVSGRVILVR